MIKISNRSLKSDNEFLKSENKALRHALHSEKKKRKAADELIDAMMRDYEQLRIQQLDRRKAYQNKVPEIMQRRLKKDK